MRALVLAVTTLLLGLVACGADEAVTCRKGGGVWECKDAAQSVDCRCAAKLPDGGAACEDSGGCKGVCVHTGGGCGIALADDGHAVGTCQSYDTRYDCIEELRLEKVDPGDPESPILVNCHSTC
jgi:hypothetical protein